MKCVYHSKFYVNLDKNYDFYGLWKLITKGKLTK